jgi:hypothetical protein
VVPPEAQMKRRLGLAYRKNGYLPPVAARVADMLRVKGKALLLIDAYRLAGWTARPSNRHCA